MSTTTATQTTVVQATETALQKQGATIREMLAQLDINDPTTIELTAEMLYDAYVTHQIIPHPSHYVSKEYLEDPDYWETSHVEPVCVACGIGIALVHMYGDFMKAEYGYRKLTPYNDLARLTGKSVEWAKGLEVGFMHNGSNPNSSLGGVIPKAQEAQFHEGAAVGRRLHEMTNQYWRQEVPPPRT